MKEGYERRRLTDLGIIIRLGFWGRALLDLGILLERV